MMKTLNRDVGRMMGLGLFGRRQGLAFEPFDRSVRTGFENRFRNMFEKSV